MHPSWAAAEAQCTLCSHRGAGWCPVAECQDARRAAQIAPTDGFRRGAVPDPTLQAPS